jgi:putative iron-dependent peroxidase
MVMDRPTEPQAVLGPFSEAAVFLVLTVEDGAEDDVRDLLADVAGLTRSVGVRDSEGDLRCIVGIGADLWDRMFGEPRPAGLHPFREVAGAEHTAVSTPGDLLFHLRARRMDLCFELAGQLMNRLAGKVALADEVQGFKYFDQRDLLGFVDGTENPVGPAAEAAITVGDEDPDFAGGSYVIVQKYLHDIDAWNALSVEEQERAIGRTKLEDIEMADDVKPSNSHIALNVITDEDGTERQIVRENMAFGSPGAREFGTYFIGYTSDPGVIEKMLSNMFIGDPPGNHDRILDFSTPITGSLFYAPTAGWLDDPPAPASSDDEGDEEAADEAPDEAPDAPRSGQSLGIGSLRSHPRP